MAKSEKLFEILELIKKDSNLKPKVLAQLCNISERAVYRYLNTLSKIGISVDFQNGGYKLKSDYIGIFRNVNYDGLEAIKFLLSEGMKTCEDHDLLEQGRDFLKLIDLNLYQEGKRQPKEIEIIPEHLRAKYRGGIITIGQGSKPDIINPILTSETISVNLMNLIFSSLIKFDNTLKPIPDIARFWEVSKDGLVWTFIIRDDIYFHDDIPLTAHDVEFTYSSIINPKSISPISDRYELVDSLETEGDYIFRIILKHPFAPFIHRLDRSIAPKHLLENVDIHKATFNHKPIGSGPFRLVEWSEDDTIVLDSNRKYYRKDRPVIDKVIFKTYSDRNSALEAMSKDEVDITFNLTASDLLFVNQRETYRVYSVDGASYYSIIFNLLDPVFKDIRLRKALDSAIDKDHIIKNQLKQYGEVCTGPFGVSSWAYNDKVKPISYSLERTKELLKTAGWSYNKKEGIWHRNGKILEISLTVPNISQALDQIAIYIRDQFLKVGIMTEIVYIDDSKLYETPFQAILTKIFVGGDPYYSCIMWHSEVGKRNLSSYCNKFVDNLIEAGKQTADLDERKAIYHKIHEMLHDDCPAIFLASAAEYIGSKYRFKNGRFLSLPHFLTTIKDWQIVDGGKNEQARTLSKINEDSNSC